MSQWCHAAAELSITRIALAKMPVLRRLRPGRGEWVLAIPGRSIGQSQGSVQRLVIGKRRSRPKASDVIFGPGGY